MKSPKKSPAARTAMFGVLTALAMILSYLETLIPLNLGIPGIKPGLANLVVLIALYMAGPLDACMISLVRVILAGITFGSLSSLVYSASGALFSFLTMWMVKSRDLLPQTGVSIVGGITHNIAQLAVAALVLESGAVFAYFPVLLLAGMITGALIGILGILILKRLPKTYW